MYWQKNAIYESSVESERSYEKETFLLTRGGKFSQNTGPAPPPPPHDVGQAQHQTQHSFLGPASDTAVYPFSIRLILLTPEVGMTRPGTAKALPSPISGPALGTNFTSVLPTAARFSPQAPAWVQVNLAVPLFFHTQALKHKNREHAATLLPVATLNGISQSWAIRQF